MVVLRRLRVVLRARVWTTATLVVIAALVPAAVAQAGGSGPPVNTVAPSISGQAKEGNNLTAKNGSWTGATPFSYAYVWEHYEAGAWRVIEGASENKFSPTSPYVGEQIRATVLASNSAGKTPSTTAPTEPEAAAPPKNHETPSIAPAEPIEGQLLTATAGRWEGTPATRYVYEWESCSKKCVVVATHETARESDTYRAPHEPGATFRVNVTDENPAGSKSAKSASTAAVKAGPPGEEQPPSIVGSAREGQPLKAENGNWYGSLPITFGYEWLSCGALTGCMPLGATGASYTPGPEQVGDTIEVTVIAKNTLGSSSATSAPTEPVTAPPHNTAPPTISGEAREGLTVTASTGSWTGTQPITYAYTWERCEPHAGCLAIEGAGDGASYRLGAGDVGDTIQVTVTASNSAGPPASATSAPTPVVEANAPESTAPPSISGEPLEGGTFTASEGGWRGARPLTFSYQWERCREGSCETTPGTGATYGLTRADVGAVVRVTVTASNSAGSSKSSPSSPTATVQGNGTAVGWGENYHGQLGQVFRDGFELSPVTVGGVSGITQLAAGGSDDYALLNSGTVVAWGGNDSGQDGDDNRLAVWEQGKSHVTVDELKGENPNEPVPLSGVKQLATADEHALAAMDDGTVKAWGANGYGDLGDGVQGKETETNVNETVARTVRWVEPETKQKAELTEIAEVAAGGGSNYALTQRGEVWAWGNDTDGQLGVRYTSHGEKPEECHTETTHAGTFEACSEIPRKVMWLNPETHSEKWEPLDHITAIAGGAWAGYAIREPQPGVKKLVAWGLDNDGQLGDKEETEHEKKIPPGYVERVSPSEPSRSEVLTGVVEVSGGYDAALARLANGEILGWGEAENYALTLPQPEAAKFKAGGEDAAEDCKKPRTPKEEANRERGLKSKIEREKGELATAEAELKSAEEAKEEKAIKTAKEKVRKDKKKIETAERDLGEPAAYTYCLKKATPLPALEELGPDKKPAEQLSAGTHFGLALQNGKVFAWGSNGHGQQGNGKTPGEGENPETGEPAPETGYALAEVKGVEHAVSVYAAATHVTVVLAGGYAPPPPPVTIEAARAEVEHLQRPAFKLEWQAQTGFETITPKKIVYKLSDRTGEEPVAEEGEGEGGEGPPVNVVLPSIELEGEPLEEAPVVGEKIKVTSGTWTGERAKFFYRWLRCEGTGGEEECKQLSKWEIRIHEGRETKKESVEVTPEELAKLRAELTEKYGPNVEILEASENFPGHTVTEADVGHTLRGEVVATNAEAEEGVSVVSAPTQKVFKTAEEAEEQEESGGRITTTLNCEKEPQRCADPDLIAYAIHKYKPEGQKKPVEEEVPLVAEPYEVKLVSPEEGRDGKIRVMVVLPDGPPGVTSNPASMTVREGEAVTFTASSSGGPRPEVQWEVSSGGGSGWSPVPGATTSTLMLTKVTTAQSGQQYRAVFTNPEGRAETAPATLTVEQ